MSNELLFVFYRACSGIEKKEALLNCANRNTNYRMFVKLFMHCVNSNREGLTKKARFTRQGRRVLFGDMRNELMMPL